jgi:3-hydroxyisobutyrate dehydrogenase-like beta-hydroxyacid dehydrogenase
MKIGFIGLGNMGSAMAKNLLNAKHSLRVYNRTPARAEKLTQDGASVATSPADAAKEAELLITMLADDAAVEEVLFGEAGAAHALPEGAVHASMSTISVELSRRLTQAHRERGQHYVAATVFGRPDMATQAKLFVVAAGDSAPIERCRPAFDAIGQKTFVVDREPHKANVVKLAGNFLITGMLEGMGESFALAAKFGIDREAFLEILTGSLFGAPAYKTYGSMIAKDRFEPVGFKLPLGFKDNRLLLRAAEEANVPMPLASLVHDRFVAALAHGLKDADWSAIAGLAYRNAGL